MKAEKRRKVEGGRRGAANLVCASFAMLVLSAAQTSAGAQGMVTEYGRYSRDRQLLEQTREIAIGPEVRFGFCFQAPVDTTEEAIMLTETLSHPPLVKNGIESGGYSMPRMFPVEAKVARGCAGYVASSAADLVPGIWRFTLSHGTEDLVVQEFILK